MRILSINEEIFLLAVWRLGENAYGVTIREKVIEMSKKPIVYGTLYNTLDNLVKKEYVITSRGEPTAERGGRSKVYYTVTDTGKTALRNSKELHASIWDGISDAELGVNA